MNEPRMYSKSYILLIVVIISLVVSFVSMNFSTRKDLTVDTLKVKGTQQLPVGQTLVKAAISYDSGSNSIVYSDGVNVLNVGTNLPGSTLIFRPGYIGTSASVFSSWEQLCEKLPLIEGQKYIYFDNSLISDVSTAMVIPTGTWDMTDVTWTRHPVGMTSVIEPNAIVTVQDGATLNGLLGIDGPLRVVYDSDTQPCIDMSYTSQSKYSGFMLRNQAHIQNNGASSFFNISTTGRFNLIIDASSIGGSNVFNIEEGIMVVHLKTGPTMEVTSLSGAGDVYLMPYTPSNAIAVPVNYPGVTGSVIVFYDKISRIPSVYTRVSAPDASHNSNRGYKIGDIWVDSTTDKFYILTDANNIAVWNGPY